MKSLKEADARGKRVFLRVDYNVPIRDGVVYDDNRIESSLPTIRHLIEQQAKIIIGTHLGRPAGSKDLSLSTIPLAKELAKILQRKVYASDFITGPEVRNVIGQMQSGDIFVLGNLRFNPSEEANDGGFASSLASMAEVYVNDAFPVCHREAASIAAITRYIPSYAGLRLEQEITTLGSLLSNPVHPFVLIVGGVKVNDKASVIKYLAPKVDKILIGGAVANTFLAASGEDISHSLFEPKMVLDCQMVLRKYSRKIMLPIDATRETTGHGYKIMDIGPATINRFSKEIKRAKTVLWNGNLGYTEDDRYAIGTKKIAESIAQDKRTAIVAGGDTAAYMDTHNLAGGFSFISTGGGAALELFAGKQLPGIVALENNKQ
ncbi:MAG: phosphoglycerate kinase [Patescibacteria group bacterium]|jgi:phosphoglycerate kinase